MGFLECLTKHRRERPFRQQKSTTPPTGKTVWAIVFTVWATEKTVAQTVNPLSDNKKEPPRGLYPALQGKDTTSKGEMQIGRRRRFIYEIAISQNNFLFYRAPPQRLCPRYAAGRAAGSRKGSQWGLSVPKKYDLACSSVPKK